MRVPLLLGALALVAACGGQSLTSPSSPSVGSGTRGPQVFYVAPGGNDSGVGTITAPWQTLRHALEQIRAGDTLYLRTGTYGDLLDFTSATSGTAWTNPVTIAAQPGERAVVTGWAGADYIVRFGNGSGYISLTGLVIDGGRVGGVTANIVFADGSHDVRLQTVEILNATGNGVFGGGNHHEFLNLNVHDNGWGADKANGMYLTTNDSTIDGGDFYNNNCFGVRFFNSDLAVNADNNSVRGARLYNNGIGRGLSQTSPCTSGGGGIVLGDIGNLAQNNQIYDNFEGIVVFGFKPAFGTKIYNNTARGNEIGIDIQAGATASDVKNNNLSGNGMGIVNLGSDTQLSGNGPQE